MNAADGATRFETVRLQHSVHSSIRAEALSIDGAVMQMPPWQAPLQPWCKVPSLPRPCLLSIFLAKAHVNALSDGIVSATAFASHFKSIFSTEIFQSPSAWSA